MTYSYYPGCTLKNKAKDLDLYARMSAQALGVTMEEISDWQCCGAVYPQAQDEIATRLSSVRTLMAARDKGQDLLTLCSACHHVVKRVNNDMKTNDDIRQKVNSYMKPEVPYAGETNVVHYLEMLRDTVGFDAVKAKVVKPLTGRRVGAYYGCMLLRPSSVMQFDQPENPTILENFIRAIGAEPVIYPDRNSCCGAYCTLEDKAATDKKSKQILDCAASFGADTVVTACPLCQYNLKHAANDASPAVIYFTELLAEALGLKD